MNLSIHSILIFFLLCYSKVNCYAYFKENIEVNEDNESLWLPKELLINIFKLLTVTDLLRCGLVCKRWRIITEFVPIHNLFHTNNFGLWNLTQRFEYIYSLKCAYNLSTYIQSYHSKLNLLRKITLFNSITKRYLQTIAKQSVHLEELYFYPCVSATFSLEELLEMFPRVR